MYTYCNEENLFGKLLPGYGEFNKLYLYDMRSLQNLNGLDSIRIMTAALYPHLSLESRRYLLCHNWLL